MIKSFFQVIDLVIKKVFRLLSYKLKTIQQRGTERKKGKERESFLTE